MSENIVIEALETRPQGVEVFPGLNTPLIAGGDLKPNLSNM